MHADAVASALSFMQEGLATPDPATGAQDELERLKATFKAHQADLHRIQQAAPTATALIKAKRAQVRQAEEELTARQGQLMARILQLHVSPPVETRLSPPAPDRRSPIGEPEAPTFGELPESLDEILAAQDADARVMAHFGKVINANEPGAGKTITSLAALEYAAASRILVVAPANATSNWVEEVRRWTPERKVVNLRGLTKGQRELLLQLLEVDSSNTVVLIGYETWVKDWPLVRRLAALRFDSLVLDEAHTIRNTETSAYKGVMHIATAANQCPFCSGIVRETKIQNSYLTSCINTECAWNSHLDDDFDPERRRSIRRVFCLTGTPLMNKPQDLFPMLKLILPQIFHSESDFLALYCHTDWSNKWVFRPKALETLATHLGGRYFRHTLKELGIELPGLTVRRLEVEMDPKRYPLQHKYSRMLAKHSQLVLTSGEQISIMSQLELLLRQRQMNVWPGGIEIKDPDIGDVVFRVGDEVQESCKVDWAEQQLREWVAEGHRCLLFSQFKPPLQELHRRLGSVAVTFDGSTSEKVRAQVRRDFNRRYSGQQPKLWDIALCNYRTGGVALNFTAATRMIILDEPWNPGTSEQTHKRIHRMGQTQPCEILIPMVPKSIDIWMEALNEHKKGLVEGVQEMASSPAIQDVLRDILATTGALAED